MDRSGSIALALVSYLLLLLAVAASADEIVLSWANHVEASDNPPFYPERALGPPDGWYAEWYTGDMEATYSAFEIELSYDIAALATFLDVSIEMVLAADFIAFEAIGAFFDFEHSDWVFTSGGVTEAFHAPDEVLATGNLIGNAFGDFFAIDVHGSGYEWAFILLDLEQISSEADDLAVTVNGDNSTPFGRPEIESMATIGAASVSTDRSSWGRIKSRYR